MRNKLISKNFLKLKRAFRKVRRSKRKRMIFLLSLFFIILILSFLIILLSSDRERAKLYAYTKMSNQATCHEDCFYKKNKLERELLENWDNNKSLFFDWQNYFSSSLEKNNGKEQEALLSLASKSSEKLKVLDYLASILIRDDISEDAKARIINIVITPLNDSRFSSYCLEMLHDSYAENLMSASLLCLSNMEEEVELLEVDSERIVSLILSNKYSLDFQIDLAYFYFSEKVLDMNRKVNNAKKLYSNSQNVFVQDIAVKYLITMQEEGYERLDLESEWLKLLIN